MILDFHDYVDTNMYYCNFNCNSIYKLYTFFFLLKLIYGNIFMICLFFTVFTETKYTIHIV